MGNSVAPLIDRRQIERGLMQGLGWLTIEELLWDSRGRVATAGASTYKLPSWSELPDEFNVAFLENAATAKQIFFAMQRQQAKSGLKPHAAEAAEALSR